MVSHRVRCSQNVSVTFQDDLHTQEGHHLKIYKKKRLLTLACNDPYRVRSFYFSRVVPLRTCVVAPLLSAVVFLSHQNLA